MPHYRLIFPVAEGTNEDAETAIIDSGDKIYAIGEVIEHGGRRWSVSQLPLEDPQFGQQTSDLMVWPAD